MGNSRVISLLTPTRGRPEAFRALLESVDATETESVEICPILDADDPTLDQYPEGGTVMMKRQPLSSLWNVAASIATGEILMQCADDIRFRTPGWDTLVTSAFEQYPDRIVYVYGRDGIADERMATHGFMYRRWYDTLGYFTWPHFTSDYGDLWNHTIAERLGRLHYLPELYTEHLHPSAGKGEWDQTHQERMERDKADQNWRRWEDAQPDLDQAVRKLQGSITTHSERSRSR